MSHTYFFNHLNSNTVIGEYRQQYDSSFVWHIDGFYRVSLFVCGKIFDIKCVTDDYGNLIAIG
jgi:hypothetical protein